ncbi:MAG: formylglycine-generating enzyme family protein [Helicobacteraceae bacterium]|nr:formylglycine-generating enzyme family protein [Helicobacteraceae bacterium]
MLGNILPVCALSHEAQAEVKRKFAEEERKEAEAKRKEAEAKRKEAEAKAETERKLAEELKKPLVEVRNLPTIKNSIGMEFVLIPPGSFQMGCADPYDDPANAKAVALGQMKRQCEENETPQHKVTLTKPFYIAKDLNITGGMWYDVTGKAMEDKNSFESRTVGENEDVGQIDLDDALKFIKALNKKEKTTKYRLPTEAELDYAMRAGTTTNFFWSDKSKISSEKYEQGHPNQYGLSFVYKRQWTGDCYYDYSAKAQVDPRVDAVVYNANTRKNEVVPRRDNRICDDRVTRGGNVTLREQLSSRARLRIVKDL